MSVLRGVCQTPAYVAYEKGFFKHQGLDVNLHVVATAWLVPQRLEQGDSQFALLPWTRVAAANQDDTPLVVIAGSGYEEAAIVVRKGMDPDDVRSVVVPLRGGMKDLTAMGLIRSIGWNDVELLRQPSGDGAIIAFFGSGADAASMVEPYATMLESMGIGTVMKRTGDIWPGAPGCSLSTTAALCEQDPELVQRFVNAFVAAVDFVTNRPAEAAEAAHKYIGVSAEHIEHALGNNRPNINAVRNQAVMDQILDLMQEMDYLHNRPSGYCDLRFLDQAQA
jgi:NitT/TauT family transport system substrate-binding protein